MISWRCIRSLTIHKRWQTNISKASIFNNEPITQDRIRSFAIIAHIDHGKSTLADRLLEETGTIAKGGKNQILDKLEVERDRGITVKAQTVTMNYVDPRTNIRYLLNLIDTPGHVDFVYEVSRSLAACEGAILLVDKTQGIQSQTLATYKLAQHLTIIPVLNKVDLAAAQSQPDINFSVLPGYVETTSPIEISAKTGLNISKVLESLVDHLPSPSGKSDEPLKALLFDSWYDPYRGVICMVNVKAGTLKAGDLLTGCAGGGKWECTEIGILSPGMRTCETLIAGQCGYIITGMRNIADAKIGDTLKLIGTKVKPFPGFKEARSMVFAGVFPTDNADFKKLQESIDKLLLEDRSISLKKESSLALGQGFRLGFLGTLHLDVFRQRLENEYQADLIITAPTVPYRVNFSSSKKPSIIVSNPADLPSKSPLIRSYEEPFILANLSIPVEYVGSVLSICGDRRGIQQDITYNENDTVSIAFLMPLAEVVTDFFDELKSATKGYALFEYEEAGYREADIVKLVVHLSGKPVDTLSLIAHKQGAQQVAKDLVTRLKTVIARQLFEVAIQVVVNGKSIARETISAMRKDVTAKCYGGDVSRKNKLLDRQKAAKKKMKMVGNVELSQEAFLTLMKR